MHLNPDYILLLKANITPTSNRVLVLRLFLANGNAFTLNTAAQELFFMEKSTIFRTLQVFESKGILHSVVTDDGVKNYALCTVDCIKDNHAHRHAHLKCSICEHLYCIPVTSLPVFDTAKRFQIDKVYMLANGTCEECNRVAS